MIPRPLEQQVQVGRGFYDLKLTQKKAMSVGEYRRLVEASGKTSRGKTTEEVEKLVG